MVQLEWADLNEADLAGVRALAERCMLVDGGLPSLATEESIRRFFCNGPAIVGRDVTDEIVAAGAVFSDAGLHPTATGFVDPEIRGVGIGEELLTWARGHVRDEPLRMLIENDTPVSEEFAHRVGMARTWAEIVMRHSLRKVPVVPRPADVEVLPWTEETAALFHRAWESSFAERPGFTPMTQAQWTEWVASDPSFRPEDSRVALDGDTPVGFVTVSTDWIDQVGVAPSWRGRGLGAHLMARSLSALQKAGSEKVWLCVTVDNPAQLLYERLGFRAKGMRARYADRLAAPQS